MRPAGSPASEGEARRFGRLVAFALLGGLAGLAAPAGAGRDTPVDRVTGGDSGWLAAWPSEKVGPILVRFADAGFADDAQRLGGVAGRVYAEAGSILPHPLLDDLELVLFKDHRLFSKATGIVESRTPAAARGNPPTIYLNLDILGPMPVSEIERILRHELAHVFVGRHIEGEIPLWLDEGIAMALAGETPDPFALLVARFSGALPHLADLRSSFPPEGEARRLAYGMSRSVVDFIVSTNHPVDGLGGFLRRLAHDRRGPALLENYTTPLLVGNLEREWLAQMRLSLVLLRLLADDRVQWTLMAVLAAAAWVVLRRRRRRRLAAMDRDEPVPMTPLFPDDGSPVWNLAKPERAAPRADGAAAVPMALPPPAVATGESERAHDARD